MPTVTMHVSVTAVTTAAATAHVSVQPPGQSATATGHVSVLVATGPHVSADKIFVVALETVTLTGSGGTIATWAADNGVTLAGTGATRTFDPPAFPDTTVVTVTVTGPGGSHAVGITVKGQPAIYRSSAWDGTIVQQTG